MTLQTQKRLAAQLLGIGETRVHLDPNKLEDIQKAITKKDIRHLIGLGYIKKLPETGVSRFRIRKIKAQKRKGRRKGLGSRKGGRLARTPRKRAWINTVRSQRAYIKKFRTNELITKPVYRELYKKSKGGFFRSVRHIRLYMEEHSLIQHAEKKN
ncbi:50S ribosomal protein L19e [Candidatus Woesearchaeota archaeon]|nr:50S ribosomal protein L19e [Candidatus Woesearchaeota archaeon]